MVPRCVLGWHLRHCTPLTSTLSVGPADLPLGSRHPDCLPSIEMLLRPRRASGVGSARRQHT